MGPVNGLLGSNNPMAWPLTIRIDHPNQLHHDLSVCMMMMNGASDQCPVQERP